MMAEGQHETKNRVKEEKMAEVVLEMRQISINHSLTENGCPDGQGESRIHVKKVVIALGICFVLVAVIVNLVLLWPKQTAVLSPELTEPGRFCSIIITYFNKLPN